MTAGAAQVWVVDDESDVLDSVALLLRSAGLAAVPCQSGAELLRRIEPESPGCVLLDLRMPGMNGLDVQKELVRRGCEQPVVFFSGHGDIPLAVRAMQDGALDFLEKPARDHRLLAAVQNALAVDRERRDHATARTELRALLASLTPRESEVAGLILDGLSSAEIAQRLGLSRRTVEMHRGRLLRRLGARNSAEAVAIVQRARAELAGHKESQHRGRSAGPAPRHE
jgi:two-component system response regulator FixJ